MVKRATRVNELVRQELSEQLHRVYQEESVYITITEVDIAPNLRSGRVYYSVVGDDRRERAAIGFFRRNGEELRRKLGERVVLKYLPHLSFVLDHSMERGSRMMDLMDSLGLEGGAQEQEQAPVQDQAQKQDGDEEETES